MRRFITKTSRVIRLALSLLTLSLMLCPSVAMADDTLELQAESTVKITTNQQTEDREVDFVSVCCESGDLDIEMTISYANGEPEKAYKLDYLYVRLDVDTEEGFKWLSPVVAGDDLSYSFHLTQGKRAAFWIFDYPKDRQNETPPSLTVKATDSKGREVYGNTIGKFRSSVETGNDGSTYSFHFSNARVEADAEDKAGLPNAKLVLSVLDDDDDTEPSPTNNNDNTGNNANNTNTRRTTNPTPSDENNTVRWSGNGKLEGTGDTAVLISVIALIASLTAIGLANRKRK